jgi:hypothetical protein
MNREHFKFALLLFCMIVIVYCAGVEVGQFYERAFAARRASDRLIAKVRETIDGQAPQGKTRPDDTEQESQD